MESCYGSVRNGVFSMVRYTDRQLRRHGVIDEIMSRGYTIHLMENPDRVIRPPTELEKRCKVEKISDLGKMLYPRDVGVKVPKLGLDGNLLNDHLPNPIVRYMGKWDPNINRPRLINGRGVSGDQYEVINCPKAIKIDLGAGEIEVENGDWMMYRDGVFEVALSNDLSAAERSRLRTSMQTVLRPTIISPTETVTVKAGSVKFLQLIETNAVRPEFRITDDGGLSDITLHPISGELYLRTDNDPVDLYCVKIVVGTSLGQLNDFEIYIDVVPPGGKS